MRLFQNPTIPTIRLHHFESPKSEFENKTKQLESPKYQTILKKIFMLDGYEWTSFGEPPKNLLDSSSYAKKIIANFFWHYVIHDASMLFGM